MFSGRREVAVFLQSISNTIYLSMRASCNKSYCSFNQKTTRCNQFARLRLHIFSWLTWKTCSKGFGKMTRFKLTRRDFLKATGSFGVASMLASGCAPAQTAGRRKRKPNLLFIWTDEQRYNTMAAYGNEKIRTPNQNLWLENSAFFLKSSFITSQYDTLRHHTTTPTPSTTPSRYADCCSAGFSPNPPSLLMAASSAPLSRCV